MSIKSRDRFTNNFDRVFKIITRVHFSALREVADVKKKILDQRWKEIF
jgi:hypothetical protein